MRRTTVRCVMMVALGGVVVVSSRGQSAVEVSAPQGVTLSIYDFGLGMVNEARRVVLASGEQTLLPGDLPGRVDPSSLSFGTVARTMPFEWIEQSFSSGDPAAPGARAVWRVKARQEGPQNFRLSYRVDGVEWRTHYQLLLAHDRLQADLNARVELVNRAGGRFENARVRLVLTERGLAGPVLPEVGVSPVARPAMRYAYGASEPSIERTIAAMAPLEIYELPRTVTLEQDRSTFIQYLQVADLPVKRFYVYDGVRFDRFQRNPRADWNYGTEYHPTVQLHVEFENAEKFGMGMNLPPGLCRLYTVRADGSIDLAGEEPLLAIPAGGTGSVRVGPAIGLRGERERTSYNEVRPNSVYEETFQIRLSNTSDEDAEIRVVEHLYRWPEFEIARADADYTRTGPQSIEFRVDLKPATRRTINYTVRYTW